MNKIWIIYHKGLIEKVFLTKPTVEKIIDAIPVNQSQAEQILQGALVENYHLMSVD
jgi:hypothetical protein